MSGEATEVVGVVGVACKAGVQRLLCAAPGEEGRGVF